MADFAVARWGNPERLTELREVVHASFREFTPPSGVLDETLGQFEARFRDGIVLVAQADDEIIGSVFCAQKNNSLYLTRMAVHPDWRQRGVGRSMLEAAEHEARALGLPKLTLRVRQTLPENRAYFERFGFVLTGEGQDPGRTPYFTMERRHDALG